MLTQDYISTRLVDKDPLWLSEFGHYTIEANIVHDVLGRYGFEHT